MYFIRCILPEDKYTTAIGRLQNALNCDVPALNVHNFFHTKLYDKLHSHIAAIDEHFLSVKIIRISRKNNCVRLCVTLILSNSHASVQF